MILLVALSLGFQKVPAEDLIKGVIGHYQRLKSYSAKVVHHGDFNSDAKDSTDTLAWLAPRRFELTSDKHSVPKIICDGKKLTTYIPDVAPISETLDMESHRILPWESRGGIVLSLCMRGTLADQWFHPPKAIKTAYAYGKTLHWHELPVSEIIETINANGATETISFYLSPDYQSIIGMEVTSGPEHAWTQYTEAKENPLLPKWLGEIPK